MKDTRAIKKLHTAEFRPIADLITYSPMPTATLRHLDPFIFLNHHGHQIYPQGNNGLPFGPHPHRGMETVTFILAGDISHKDSGGHESVIEAGGIQWMTAGRGLIHTEVSSDKFKQQGGELEILQLWVNLPAKHKMTEPKYLGLQEKEITSFTTDNDKVRIQLISGEWGGKQGSFQTLSPILLTTIHLEQGGEFTKTIPDTDNIFFYLIKGKLEVNGKEVNLRTLAEFENAPGEVRVKALEDSILIFGHAQPFNEPIVAQGPFVMNSLSEIEEAYRDYQTGKFGTWKG
jgi:quercetin 2,3-dioxygenase